MIKNKEIRKILIISLTTSIIIQIGAINVFAENTINKSKGKNTIELSSKENSKLNKSKNVEFIGVEEKNVLIGDTFKFKDGVQVIENGLNVANNLIIVNSSGVDITNIDSVKIEDNQTYTYIYKYLDSNGVLHEKRRDIKGINTKASANISKIKQNQIELIYNIKNEYSRDINIKLEDWALYPKNHKEDLGILNPNQENKLVRRFTMVPSIKSSESIPDSDIGGNSNDNPKSDVVYLPSNGILGFAPNFSIYERGGDLISSFSLNTEENFTDLVNNAEEISKKLNIKATFENKNIKVGDKIKIKYEIENNYDKILDFKVESWTYFGKYKEEYLGKVNPKSKKTYEKEIVVTADMIDKDNKLKSDIQAYHIYNELNDELFVKKYNIERLNNSGGSSGGSSSGSNVPTIMTKVEDIVGKDRFETAFKISNKWSKSDNVIISNAYSMVDNLTATPFAYAKNAPILLSNKNKLNEITKAELTRLKTKTVYLIGGLNVLDNAVEKEICDMGINVVRIGGANRFETSLKLAIELDKIKDISKLALVNGENGLADAVSISSFAAESNMPIILSNNKGNIPQGKDFIKLEDIKQSYIIGGTSVVPSTLDGELSNLTNNKIVERISGSDRNETNSNIINKFYTSETLNNLFVSKNGMRKENELIDSLVVGVLSAKEKSPIILVGNSLTESQKDIIYKKKFKKITKIGGKGNENSFNEIKEIKRIK